MLTVLLSSESEENCVIEILCGYRTFTSRDDQLNAHIHTIYSAAKLHKQSININRLTTFRRFFYLSYTQARTQIH